jgi:excisionase family DNA binding protein
MDIQIAGGGGPERQRLLTVRELADFLRIPVNTVYKWSTEGGGPPAYKVGKYLRFRVEDVLAWLESRKKQE